MRAYLVLSTVLMLLSHGVAQTTGKLDIAVTDIKGNGIDQGTAGILSDRLRSELLNTGQFRVMERNEMQNILKEQGFQRSGACEESSCLVQVGQLLGVQRMVAGSVGKVGNFWTISLRMLNVATGEILFTISEDYEGDIKGVFSTLLNKAATKIATGAGAEVRKAAVSGKKGDLYIVASQQGASVEVDDKAVSGVTPLTIQGFAAGEHRIVVRKGDWYGSQTIDLNPDDLMKVTVSMERGKGAIKVFSTPDGAFASLDGKYCGQTPVKIDGVAAGEHDITIKNDGYVDAEEKVNVAIGEMTNVRLTLGIAAYIKLIIFPEDATALVNGRKPLRNGSGLISVPAGNVTIHATAEGRHTYDSTFVLSAGDTNSLNISLPSMFGTIKVLTMPAGAVVFVNEKNVGVTPFSDAHIEPGNLMLKVESPNYEVIRENLSIVKGHICERNYKLKHTKAFLDSVDAFSQASYQKRRWIRRLAFGIGAVCGLGGGLYYNMSAQKDVNDQKAIQAEYDAAKMNFDMYQSHYTAKGNDAHGKIVTRNILFGISVLAAMGFGISIPF
jgi:TolB-like protein